MTEISEAFLGLFRNLPGKEQPVVLASILREMADTLDGTPDVLPAAPAPIPPRPGGRLIYDSPGTLSGPVKGHDISVVQRPHRRFRTTIDGTEYQRLGMRYVEDEFEISVNRKSNGGNAETVSRAIYRHLVDRYNDHDSTVTYVSL